MVSIDAPKTLYFPSSADMKIINDKYVRKAWFLQYKEDKENVNLKLLLGNSIFILLKK